MAGNSLDIKQIYNTRDQKAAYIASTYDQWIMGRREAEKLWAEVDSFLYATDTRNTTNAQNPWDNTTHIPKLAQIRDNLEANYLPALFPNDDWFRFMGDSPESVSLELRRKLEGYFKVKHLLADFETVIMDLLRDWISKGNCFIRVDHITRYTTDPITGEQVLSYVGPWFTRISPYDIVMNPIATSFERSPIIIRSLYTRGELARMAEEYPEDWPQETLDKIDSIRYTARVGAPRDTNKYLNLKVDGYGSASQYLSSGYVEVLEFYGDMFDETDNKFYKNRCIRVVDRMWVVTDKEITTWSGRPHIYHCGWRIRPDNLWAQGPLEPLVGMQYRLNHLENAKADAYDQQLDPDLVITGSMDIIQDGARKLYISEDTAGRVARLAPETTILQANLEIGQLMNLMEELAGAPRDAMGIRTPGEKTAFEVGELYERAGRVFQNKVQHFERELIRKVLGAELELTRTHLNAAETFPVQDEDGIIEFMELTPDDIRSKGRLIPVGAQHFSEQARLVQTLSSLHQSWLQDPAVNVHISGKRLAQVIVDDILNYSKFQLYQPFVRITEQAEGQMFAAAAQEEVATQDAMAAEGFGEGGMM